MYCISEYAGEATSTKHHDGLASQSFNCIVKKKHHQTLTVNTEKYFITNQFFFAYSDLDFSWFKSPSNLSPRRHLSPFKKILDK